MSFALATVCVGPVYAQDAPPALARPERAPASPTSIDRLEAIIRRARSLGDFLAQPKLIDEYFLELQAYFGADRMPRQSFDMILSQVRQLARDVPGFQERLWTRVSFDSFSFDVGIQSHGRTLNAEGWQVYQSEWLTRLEREAATILAVGDPTQQTEALLKTLRDASAEIEAFEDSMLYEKSLSAEKDYRAIQEAKSKRSRFSQDFKKKPEIQAASSALLLRYLQSESMQDAFRSGDADIILSTFEELRQAPEMILEGMVGAPAGIAARLDFRPKIEALESLRKRTDVFPVRQEVTRRGRTAAAAEAGAVPIDFRAVETPFHGIWRGIPLGECVGGSCKYLEHTTPDRWAVTLLKQARLYYVERAGRHLGFVHEIPIKRVDTGEIYVSVDLASRALGQKSKRERALPGEPRAELLFERWLRHRVAQLPKSWRGYLLGENAGGDNSAVLTWVRRSAAYLMGLPGGASADYAHLDAFGENLPGKIKLKGRLARAYGSRMVFDAFLGDQNPLTLLMPREAGTLADAEIMRGWMRSAPEAAVLRLVASPSFRSGAFGQLIPELLAHSSQKVRRATLSQLTPQELLSSMPVRDFVKAELAVMAAPTLNDYHGEDLKIFETLNGRAPWVVPLVEGMLGDQRPHLKYKAAVAHVTNGGPLSRTLENPAIDLGTKLGLIHAMRLHGREGWLEFLLKRLGAGDGSPTDAARYLEYLEKSPVAPGQEPSLLKALEHWLGHAEVGARAQQAFLANHGPGERVLQDPVFSADSINTALKDPIRWASESRRALLRSLSVDTKRADGFRAKVMSVYLKAGGDMADIRESFYRLEKSADPKEFVGFDAWNQVESDYLKQLAPEGPGALAFALRCAREKLRLDWRASEAARSRLLAAVPVTPEIRQAYLDLIRRDPLDTRVRLFTKILGLKDWAPAAKDLLLTVSKEVRVSQPQDSYRANLGEALYGGLSAWMEHGFDHADPEIREAVRGLIRFRFEKFPLPVGIEFRYGEAGYSKLLGKAASGEWSMTRTMWELGLSKPNPPATRAKTFAALRAILVRSSTPDWSAALGTVSTHDLYREDPSLITEVLESGDAAKIVEVSQLLSSPAHVMMDVPQIFASVLRQLSAAEGSLRYNLGDAVMQYFGSVYNPKASSLASLVACAREFLEASASTSGKPLSDLEVEAAEFAKILREAALEAIHGYARYHPDWYDPELHRAASRLMPPESPGTLRRAPPRYLPEVLATFEERRVKQGAPAIRGLAATVECVKKKVGGIVRALTE